jgi:hypothetical protein
MTAKIFDRLDNVPMYAGMAGSTVEVAMFADGTHLRMTQLCLAAAREPGVYAAAYEAAWAAGTAAIVASQNPASEGGHGQFKDALAYRQRCKDENDRNAAAFVAMRQPGSDPCQVVA